MRVLIADDHPIVLMGIRQVLSQRPDVSIVGEAKDPAALLAALAAQPCDAVITDFAMPGGSASDGLAMLAAIRAGYPATRIIVLTMLTNHALLQIIRDAGAFAVLSKRGGLEELPRAIGQMADDPSSGGPRPAGLGAIPAPQLSPREVEVVRLCASGLTLTDIAQMHGRSIKTVSTHKHNAMNKLGLKSDAELVLYASGSGLA
ncbi:response regulator transcription factor [Burkholderia sp. FERM BP-3421]|nr:response regulator transcription factor [Burkholderia sp. FERM BP-3421]WDD91522.1 response regulator transcription factor [Burkholderia sp. FERM BP-3421]